MRGRGFTLVEILIVVVILAILAMVVVPQFSAAVDDTKQTATAQTQQMIQKQIVLYIAEHGGRAPHINEEGIVDTVYFISRLTCKTDPSGKINDSSGSCGPYLDGWPANPMLPNTNNRLTGTIEFGTATWGSGKTAWYFNMNTHEFKANDPTSIAVEKSKVP